MLGLADRGRVLAAYEAGVDAGAEQLGVDRVEVAHEHDRREIAERRHRGQQPAARQIDRAHALDVAPAAG